jgi:uncharacterized protein YndB with AHSA1/START domain
MTLKTVTPDVDPKTDLVLERVVDVPRRLVWKAWTEPEHLMPWYCPLPWKTVECEIDLRPGGLFKTVMRSPEGEDFPHLGCYLEVIPQERLVWTDALVAGFRPSLKPMLEPVGPFTAVITLEDEGKGTRYTAHVMHRTAEAARKHDEIGFSEGWGIALTQMVDYLKAGI